MKPVSAPGAPEGLILYDGDCVLCSRWVRWVIARDAARRYRFTPVQGRLGRSLALEIGLDPDEPQSNAVIRDGLALFKSDAALSVVSTLPGWSGIGRLNAIPRLVRDSVYDFIAANRYRFLGRSAQCWVPDTEDRDRFLD